MWKKYKRRIHIHALFDFGLCCMESFSPLTSIRKILKFVAALSKYYGIVHDIVYISRLPGYLETKTTYVECDMDINKFAMRFGG